MDMYQKRKMRKEKSANKQEECSDNKMNINWYIPPYGKLPINACK